MIEHVSDQELVLAEILRVLAPDGLLIISTPERHAYQESTGQPNQFHSRELTEPEFRDLFECCLDSVCPVGIAAAVLCHECGSEHINGAIGCPFGYVPIALHRLLEVLTLRPPLHCPAVHIHPCIIGGLLIGLPRTDNLGGCVLRDC
jgi:SAM-dependent methyltransferase